MALSQVAADFVAMAREECCGECLPGFNGMLQVADLVQKLSEGKVSVEEKALLKQTLDVMARATKCRMGRLSARFLRQLLCEA
ncbi:NADH-ubiquinone oxidoreductase-F iron-sulfur binding region domain-containing protein [Ammonifex degensii]|uniref:NADH-ubiquinone oxidoreductase-F iron-sulfur binding region domain-containing protein n=1 Tax=Ammonifex degensii TaxID=42838 RepID=UPI0002DAF074|nr:NADH-ubiquinone oxidoreductase-F iron-sulfur binding region domain-containing protein [Ammonifex degensii]